MEIKNKFICKAVYIPTGDIYYACSKGGWVQFHRRNSAQIFSASGATIRVNSINSNQNWDAKKIPLFIKVLDDDNK